MRLFQCFFSLLLVTGTIYSFAQTEEEIVPGAARMNEYLSRFNGNRIAVVANQTSVIHHTHLVDTLNRIGKEHAEIIKIFTPEHGFRGKQEAGVQVNDGVDERTGIPVVSLYGDHRKPSPEDLRDVDLVLFDIQDVGVRFFTYISTLHYVMEACAESGIPLIVLDRPNPNGGYIDGPVLEQEYASFVGMHPIPVVYGMTIGEVALMINGEGWLSEGIHCDVTVVPCKNYYHGRSVSLPVKPSPNLPDDQAVNLYPSLCFFEETVISEGRGTVYPFEVYGHPDLDGPFRFTPHSIPGMSLHPKLEGRVCFGEDLREYVPAEGWTRLYLQWLIRAYNQFPDKEHFFIPYFENLAGTSILREQIRSGRPEEEIRQSWAAGLEKFRGIRKNYLLYGDPDH